MKKPYSFPSENFDASRRAFLYGLGASLGSVSLTSLMAQDGLSAINRPSGAKPSMFPGKAKACIFLFMEGGPGQMDTFDPKPLLQAKHTTQSCMFSQEFDR